MKNNILKKPLNQPVELIRCPGPLDSNVYRKILKQFRDGLQKQQSESKKLFENIFMVDDKDRSYERNKELVDTLGIPLKSHHARQTFRNAGQSGPLFHTHRRGLLQFISYLDADSWIQRNGSFIKGPCSFFIKGYKWPWHTKRDWKQLLFMTDACPKKKEKKPL